MKERLRFAACTALALATAPAGAEPATLSEHLAPLAPLVGSCWEGRFAERDLVDIRCVLPMLDGRHVRDIHAVIGTGYAGETIYSWDARAGRIVFTYYNVLGDSIEGVLTPTESGWSAESVHRGADGAQRRLRAEIAIEGDRVVQQSFEGARPTARIEFERRPADAYPELLGYTR